MLQSLVGLSLIAAASAHQNIHQLWINDVTPGYQVGLRMPPSNSPVTDVQSNDIACNVDGSIVPSGVETIAASEGDKITVTWDTSGHPGPITHFLLPVDDAAQATGIGAGWFKIDELDYVDGKWANEVIMANGGNYSFNLPTGLASGEYLLRSEMLALHGAQTVGGAQFYIGCGQLKITGTGSGSFSPTISLPGAYNAEDANIYIPNVYNGFDATTYTAPGGPIASAGGSGSGSSSTTSTPVAASTAASSATDVSSSVQAATTSAPLESTLPPVVTAPVSATVIPIISINPTETVTESEFTLSASAPAVETTTAAPVVTTSASASAVETGDESCEPEETDVEATPSATSSAAAPVETGDGDEGEGDDDDDDSCDTCDAEETGAETTSAGPTSAPTSTGAALPTETGSDGGDDEGDDESDDGEGCGPVTTSTPIAPTTSARIPISSTLSSKNATLTFSRPTTFSTRTASGSASSPTGFVAKFNRCGGIGHSGPTACASGTTCKVQNPYYSQCI